VVKINAIEKEDLLPLSGLVLTIFPSKLGDILSHRMYQLSGFRKSTPPQKRQLTV
jgi:hypothetical protein